MNSLCTARRAARGLAVAAAAGVLAMVAPATALAQGAQAAQGRAVAEPDPTYKCELVFLDSPYVDGYGCAALHGAPETGPVEGPLVLANYRGMRFECRFALANVPDTVRGFGCEPAGSEGAAEAAGQADTGKAAAPESATDSRTTRDAESGIPTAAESDSGVDTARVTLFGI